MSFQASTIFTTQPAQLTDRGADILADIEMTRGMDDVFLANAEAAGFGDSDLKWQYVGTTHGAWRIYPGLSQETCYDCKCIAGRGSQVKERGWVERLSLME